MTLVKKSQAICAVWRLACV